MDSEFAYLGTVGRRSGRWHVVEIWYGERAGVFYLMSGGGESADWVRNLRANPRVRLRIGGPRELGLDDAVEATAAFVTDPVEDAMARRLLAQKYQGWRAGGELSDWARTALVVAVYPDSPAGTAEHRSG
jgi:deazaflavin-dependent oxidoreductase (nitroreductase family)